MRVFLPYPPSANARLTIRKGGKGLINTARYRAWKQEAAWLVHLAVRDTGEIMGPYRLDAVAMPPPLSRIRDLDNLLKATCDALKEGYAVEDDSHCQEINIRWGQLDGPGILVEVESCPNLLSAGGGKSRPPGETTKPRRPRQSRPAATSQAATRGALTDMAAWAWLGLGDQDSFTPADDTACPKPKARRKT